MPNGKILNGSKAWDCAYNVSVVATRHLMQWMKQVMLPGQFADGLQHSQKNQVSIF